MADPRSKQKKDTNLISRVFRPERARRTWATQLQGTRLGCTYASGLPTLLTASVMLPGPPIVKRTRDRLNPISEVRECIMLGPSG